MKRSESVLVYGVTGVLVVILAIAIIFGGETPNTQPDGEKLAIGGGAKSSDGTIPFLDENALSEADRELELLLDDTDVRPADPASADRAGDDGVEPVEPIKNDVPIVPLHRTVTLGVSRTEENPASGERFRFVRVKPGDSISLLIQYWCPGTDQEIVAALNETKSLDRLHPGDEICVPWVDDDILEEAMKRREANPPTVAVTPQPEREVGVVPAVAAGSTYTLKEGDSLWLVAKRKVGAGKADAYVRQILATNPSIEDAASVRAGQKITLPN